MTEAGVPLLKSFDRETVISVLTVVTFVVSCKMYNYFIAKPKEMYSDVDITKFTIIGVFAAFATKAAVTALFERRQPCVHATGPDGRYTTGVFRTVDTHGTGLKP